MEARAAQGVAQRGAERVRLPGLRGVERRGRQRHVEAAAGRGGAVGVDGDHGRGVGPLARRATHVDARADADVVRPGQHHAHARRLQRPLGALRHVEGEGVLGIARVGGGARRVAGLACRRARRARGVRSRPGARRCPRCARDPAPRPAHPRPARPNSPRSGQRSTRRTLGPPLAPALDVAVGGPAASARTRGERQAAGHRRHRDRPHAVHQQRARAGRPGPRVRTRPTLARLLWRPEPVCGHAAG